MITDLWRTYEYLVKSGQPIAMRKVNERGQIFPVFHDLFARGGQGRVVQEKIGE